MGVIVSRAVALNLAKVYSNFEMARKDGNLENIANYGASLYRMQRMHQLEAISSQTLQDTITDAKSRLKAANAPKVATPVAATPVSPVKRGPGRPRKTAVAVTAPSSA